MIFNPSWLKEQQSEEPELELEINEKRLRVLTNMRVRVLVGEGGGLRIRFDRWHLRITLLLSAEFPKKGPIAVVEARDRVVRTFQIPWARRRSVAIERRLARVVRWLCKGFAQRF